MKFKEMVKDFIGQLLRGSLHFSNYKLTSLEGCSKIIGKTLNCKNNPDLKNVVNQIIEFQIKEKYYQPDEGYFYFEDIKEKFENYEKSLEIKKSNQEKFSSKDYGLSI